MPCSTDVWRRCLHPVGLAAHKRSLITFLHSCTHWFVVVGDGEGLVVLPSFAWAFESTGVVGPVLQLPPSGDYVWRHCSRCRWRGRWYADVSVLRCKVSEGGFAPRVAPWLHAAWVEALTSAAPPCLTCLHK